VAGTDGSVGAVAIARVADQLLRSIEASPPATGRCTLLFSGGLDSSLIAHVLRDRAPVLFTLGTPGASDPIRAAEAADWLGLDLTTVEVTPDLLRYALARCRPHLRDATPTATAVALGLALGVSAAPTSSVLCGQGADELFLGYAHFRGTTPAGRAARQAEDLRSLLDVEWPRAIAIAGDAGRTLASPYLDPALLTLARQLGPSALGDPDPRSKPLLRAVARRLGLDERLVERPKKAFQYGSGIDRALRRRTGPAAEPRSGSITDGGPPGSPPPPATTATGTAHR